MTGEHTRTGRPVRSTRSIGLVALATVALALAALWTVTSAGTAMAATEPAPSPSDNAVTPTPPPLDGPTITSPASGSFVGSGSVVVSGTKDPGTGLQLTVGRTLEPACIIPQDERADWSCGVDLPDGPGLSITAAETGTAETLTAQISISALAPPTISADTPSNGGVRGTAYPGATVSVRADSGASCSFTADGSGSWFCILGEPLRTGTLQVTATQSASFSGGETSDASSPVTLTIDRDAPAPPTVTSPTSGQTLPLTAVDYAGTGEEGATVTVFADSASVCVATVVGGSWSCSAAGVTAGRHIVLAIQQDAAGNTSGASTPLTLTYGDASAAPVTPAPSSTPSPSNGAVPPAAPGTPQPGTPQPSPTPSQDTAPGAGPMVGGGGPWSGSTPFSQTLASTIDGRGQPVWWLAALLALAAVALVAVPARLLASSLAPVRAVLAERRRSSVTGRNRPRAEFERAPTIALPSRAVIAVVSAVVAAGLLMFAHPVDGRPAYLRLWFASLLAVLAINAGGLLVQLLVARHERLGPMRVVVRPSALVTVGVVTVVSRLLTLQPALLFGLLAELRPVHRPGDSPTTAEEAVTARSGGRLALARIGAAAALGSLAWLVSSLVGEPDSGFSALLVEAVNLTAITGIGSAAVALLPLGTLGGRAVLDWSKPVWLGSAFVAFTLLFGLLGPTATAPGATQTLLGVLVATLVFAAVVSGAWAWRRHVRPLLDTH